MEFPSDDLRQTLSSTRGEGVEPSAELLEFVYEPLRALAESYFRSQPIGHTLQPTALVHEAYLKVAGGQQLVWQDRAHFLAVCARAMRSILVDHARGKAATKRGGELRRVPFEGAVELGASADLDVLDLEEHLELLGSLNERQARIAECRLFAGMTIREVAEALGVSPRTVDDDWAMARAWLSARLGGAA